tara:strand:+ start:1312 stop:1611 length:300 start_codon:yes stop_codon:yes gene_type:complete
MVEQYDGDPSGTSFYNVTINTTPQKLIDKLGEPGYFENDGSDKTNMDYILTTDGGVKFTIYDWKEYAPLQMNAKYDFHIGGFSRSDCDDAFIALCKMGL